MAGELLDEHSVGPYLRSRGLEVGDACEAQMLTGGVSNVVLGVRGGAVDCVVKQSLGRLRVADEWYAPRERVLTEATALQLAAELTPGCVPHVLDRDAENSAIVLERAQLTWRDWKTSLLAGTVATHVAARLGEILGTWHRITTDRDRLPAELRSVEPFEQLRIEPYYRTTAERVPELGDEILSLADELGRRRACMVHGDFSPKNVLVAPGGEWVWVIDFEVAHYGDPAFDLAFMISHLLLKAIHLPEQSVELDECLTGFVDGYQRASQVDRRREVTCAERGIATVDWPYVSRHVGALLIARLRGKSPVEYLCGDEPEMVRRLGFSLLRSPADGATAIVERRKAMNPSDGR